MSEECLGILYYYKILIALIPGKWFLTPFLGTDP